MQLPPSSATVLVVALLTRGLAAESTPREAVAVIAALSGSAWTAASAHAPVTTAHLFDWLEASAFLEVAPHSSVTLAFVNGSRYELGQKTKVTLTATGPEVLSGVARPLEPFPPLPRVVGLGSVAQAGPRSAAIRIRGQCILRGLYPRADTTTFADHTVLSFAPTGDAANYRVELEDEDGRTLFEAQTRAATVTVPPEILKPGARYRWSVEAADRRGSNVCGQSNFATLATEDIDRRAALRAILERKGDAISLALLAEFDRRLGLLAEARDDFAAALAKSPNDEALRRALEHADRQLALDRQPPEF